MTESKKDYGYKIIYRKNFGDVDFVVQKHETMMMALTCAMLLEQRNGQYTVIEVSKKNGPGIND